MTTSTEYLKFKKYNSEILSNLKNKKNIISNPLITMSSKKI